MKSPVALCALLVATLNVACGVEESNSSVKEEPVTEEPVEEAPADAVVADESAEQTSADASGQQQPTAEQCQADAGAAGAGGESGEGFGLTEPGGVHFFQPTARDGGWQSGAAGAACGRLLNDLAVQNNWFGRGDQERAFAQRMQYHGEGLRRLREMFPSQEGFFSGIWSYTPEQLQQAGVERVDYGGWRNWGYRVR